MVVVFLHTPFSFFANKPNALLEFESFRIDVLWMMMMMMMMMGSELVAGRWRWLDGTRMV
jgi:hypothetical protein